MKETFGKDVIDRTEEVWGLDAEGECRGCYRPSGQPGVSASMDSHVSSEDSIKQFSALVRCRRFLGISFLFKNAGEIPGKVMLMK
jgi:hypothetical protein